MGTEKKLSFRSAQDVILEVAYNLDKYRNLTLVDLEKALGIGFDAPFWYAHSPANGISSGRSALQHFLTYAIKYNFHSPPPNKKMSDFRNSGYSLHRRAREDWGQKDRVNLWDGKRSTYGTITVYSSCQRCHKINATEDSGVYPLPVNKDNHAAFSSARDAFLYWHTGTCTVCRYCNAHYFAVLDDFESFLRDTEGECPKTTS